MSFGNSKVFFKAMDDEDVLEESPEPVHEKAPLRKVKRREKPKPLKETKPPKRGLLRFLSRSKDSTAKNDSTDNSVEEEDPVVDVLRSRTTQRVRFSLGHEEIIEGDSAPKQIQTPKKSSMMPTSPASKKNISRFMKAALFSQGRSMSQKDLGKEYEDEAAKQIEIAKKDSTMVWASAYSSIDMEEVRTKPGGLTISFEENPATREKVLAMLQKASLHRTHNFRYSDAVSLCMEAHGILVKARYPTDHPIMQKAVNELNTCHHAFTSYKDSANIIKMGIKYEDNGELIRALKMYTIAYRIRRDNLSRLHPSLIVLLNMLGSIQIKRGELAEAMDIFHLALDDANREAEESPQGKLGVDLMARSVSYREMGIIYEKWGDQRHALEMYHLSLDCIAEFKGISQEAIEIATNESQDRELVLDESLGLSKSFTDRITAASGEDDGMELYIGSKKEKRAYAKGLRPSSTYDVFFPVRARRKISDEKTGDASDVDIALTLHQIAQLHRAQGEFNLALAAFNVALRGMKRVLGKSHPNVAAILGNMGNLQKEMGEYDAAFSTYQQVLKIESNRLGLSHPAVVITLHNIATIDAARGKSEQSLLLYEQVLQLQRKLHGVDHPSVAITSACMGDVYEKMGRLPEATECFEEAVRIKTSTSGRHSLEVARLLHKLGRLSMAKSDFHLADSYMSRAILVYRLNKLTEEDEWLIAAERDSADIDAKITMGKTSPTGSESSSSTRSARLGSTKADI